MKAGHYLFTVLVLVCAYLTAGFYMVDNVVDGPLQTALTANQELNRKLNQVTADNDQLRQRLQAAETTISSAIPELNSKLNQMKADNDQLRQRLQAAETAISSVTQNIHSMPESRMLTDFVWFGEWVLVFRATAGIQTHTYETYTNRGHHDDDPENRVTVPCGCTTVNGSLPCDRHYRSRLLDSWPSTAIDKVRLTLFENGVEKEHVTFSGTGSDYTSWFTNSRVVDSSWSDLLTTQSFQFFSIEGDVNLGRRFEIMHVYNNCPGDIGWLTVKDIPTDFCGWGTSSHVPAFIYAPNNRELLFQDPGFRHADVMAIFVKFRPNADLSQMCLN